MTNNARTLATVDHPNGGTVKHRRYTAYRVIIGGFISGGTSNEFEVGTAPEL